MTNAFDLSDVRASWSFTIPIAMPSANAMHRRGFNHHVYRRLRDDILMLVQAYGRGVPAATGPRKVTLTRLIGKNGKLYDADNLVAGCKPLVDVLVMRGLLQGDAPHQVVVEYQQERSGEHGTRVELTEEMP
jgi:hypothetical protein